MKALHDLAARCPCIASMTVTDTNEWKDNDEEAEATACNSTQYCRVGNYHVFVHLPDTKNERESFLFWVYKSTTRSFP